jgi:cbb3-type cytochrome oxidase subunit 3
MKKTHKQLVIILLISGVGYYFFVYLPKKRDEAKKAINKLFQQNSSITATDLDSNL